MLLIYRICRINYINFNILYKKEYIYIRNAYIKLIYYHHYIIKCYNCYNNINVNKYTYYFKYTTTGDNNPDSAHAYTISFQYLKN